MQNGCDNDECEDEGNNAVRHVSFSKSSKGDRFTEALLRRGFYWTEGAKVSSRVGSEVGNELSESTIGSEHVVDLIMFLCRIARASSIRPLTIQLRKLPRHSNRGTLLEADRKKLCTAFSASL
jgi:hypothetical protein